MTEAFKNIHISKTEHGMQETEYSGYFEVKETKLYYICLQDILAELNKIAEDYPDVHEAIEAIANLPKILLTVEQVKE